MYFELLAGDHQLWAHDFHLQGKSAIMVFIRNCNQKLSSQLIDPCLQSKSKMSESFVCDIQYAFGSVFQFYNVKFCASARWQYIYFACGVYSKMVPQLYGIRAAGDSIRPQKRINATQFGKKRAFKGIGDERQELSW